MRRTFVVLLRPESEWFNQYAKGEDDQESAQLHVRFPGGDGKR
jgi:hypothetical protein